MTGYSLFIDYLTLSRPIAYLLIFAGMIIEGDVVLFAAAFLAHQKILDIGDTFIIVLFGTIIGDMLWYLAGLRLNNSFLFLKRWADKIAQPLDGQLINHPFKTIFISKFIYGIHHAILFRAGTIKIPFRRFAVLDLPAIIIWVVIIGVLGYGAGVSFLSLKHYLQFAEFGLAASLFLFFMLLHFIKKLL